MKHAKILLAAFAAVAVALSLAACGGGEDSTATTGKFELLPDAPAAYMKLTGDATLERSGDGTTVSLQLSGLEPRMAYVAHVHSGTCTESDPGGPHFKFDAGGSDEPPNEINLEFTSTGDGEGQAKASNDREVPAGEARSIVLHVAGDEHETAAGAGEVESILVHEGHHHGEEAEGQPDKIACAELEAASTGEGASSGAVPTIVIRDGEPVGGVQELEYSAGDQIQFRVSSDVADEVHVHGYDVMKDVAAGGDVSFSIPAEIEGIFEVELEGRKEQIAELRVNP